MKNSEMKKNRFKVWADARRKLEWIKARISEGRTVQVTTYTRATRYTQKHLDMFRATKTGLLVQRGKSWDCLDHSKLTAF
jgi:hypothetical protein